MINVGLNEENFEYDIHSLVKAFYGSHDVKVKCQNRDAFEDEAIFYLNVDYDKADSQIKFDFYNGLDNEASMSGAVSVNFDDRTDTKNKLKQKLYEMLSEYSGQVLPWGTLTGIRPTKIPMGMMEEGISDDQIKSYMKETYFASDEKIDLAMNVARLELDLLKKIDYENGYSLYVGIPFCPSTCLYCSFTSYPLFKWAAKMDEYIDAVIKEIDYVSEVCKEKTLDSVYIGGGTPTSLTHEQLDRLIGYIIKAFNIEASDGKILYRTERGGKGILEFTVEAGRPDSITREKFEVLYRRNVNRISINPQTMKDETLKIIGRHHTVQQTVDAFKMAREIGFDNINMDLIVGLPNETIQDVENTMKAVMELGPDNVTVHSLAIKRAARLKMNWDQYADLSMENTWDTIALTAKYCKEMGMEPYYLYRQKNMAGNFENVGYAHPGKAGIYNILIMEEKQTIMALGAGAMTKFVLGDGRIERVENVKDVTNYLERIDEMIERKEKRMEELAWL